MRIAGRTIDTWFLRSLVAVMLVVGLVGGLALVAAMTGADDDQQRSRTYLIAAAGDIACAADDPAFNGGQGEEDVCAQERTAELLHQNDYDAVLALGDLQYSKATLKEFRGGYDKSWGSVKGITYPVPGNHESRTEESSGYFDYFNGVGKDEGRAGERGKGYYSFDLGEWHLVALNSNCGDAGVEGGCSAKSPQVEWLAKDLEENPAKCTLAFWHSPRFSSSSHDRPLEAFWDVLYEHRVDVVLNGHTHSYERFKPSDPNGRVDTERGIRQFIVGTGGRSFTDEEPDFLDNSTGVHNRDVFGILEMKLFPTGYEWRFIPEERAAENKGQVFSDEGSADCH
jgi:Calcineurin-like phosphoesterase